MYRFCRCISLALCLFAASMAAKGQSVASSSEEFTIHYKVDRTDINPTYLQNKENIAHIRNYLKNSPRIDSITIYAWASPEGGYRHNVWLSKERAKTAKRFLLETAADSSRLTAGKIKISPLAENWPGLEKIVVERYARHDREKVLKILRDTTIGDETRKWRLQQLDGGYTWRYMLRNYMPQLRAATWICVWAEVIELLPAVDAMTVEVAALTETAPVRESAPVVTVEEQKTIVALKTNMLLDAVTAVNFAVEVPFEIKGNKFSALYEHHTPWWLTKNNKYCLQFLTYGGEARWWFAPRTTSGSDSSRQRDALAGHFLGIYGWGGIADIQAGRNFGCYQFDFWSTGLTYGYSMPIASWANLELSISAGYANIPYQHYIPTDDWQILIKDKSKAGTLHYFGPTKAEISLVIPIYYKGGRR